MIGMQHKVGVIGYGNMAHFHHTKILKPNNIIFHSAYDISDERLKKAKENGLKTYNNLEDFLNDDEIDIVLVATPNNFHKEYAIAAANHKKHIICEKPVAMNLSEFSEMVNTAKRNCVLITTHQNRRMDSDYRIIKQIINDKTIGEVFRIESRIEGSRGIADTWRRRKKFGGGMMYDWGVHLIDQLLDLIPSKVTSVFAQFQYISTNEVDDNFRLMIEFENGVSALAEIGTCNYIMHPLWYVQGKTGTAQINYWDLDGKIVQLIDNDIKWEDEIPVSIAGPSLTMAPRAHDTAKTIHLPKPIVDDGIFYRNLTNAVEGTEELWIKPEETMRVMKIIDLAFESGRKNQVIHCEI